MKTKYQHFNTVLKNSIESHHFLTAQHNKNCLKFDFFIALQETDHHDNSHNAVNRNIFSFTLGTCDIKLIVFIQ